MSYIKSYGIALPHFRMEDVVLNPKGKKGFSKAIGFSDEDLITLAYEASCNLSLENMDGIFFAASSSVFGNRYHASFLADLLNLPKGILALDFTNTTRSGTDALMVANDLLDSRKYKNILVIAAELTYPEIGKEHMKPWGQGACAILLGNEQGLAQIVSGKSYSSPISEAFLYKGKNVFYDPRFIRDAGFKTSLTASLKNFVSKPEQYELVVLNSLYSRMAEPVFLKAGFQSTQLFADKLIKSIGQIGSAHALFLLIAAIEQIQITQEPKNIFLLDYTNGSNLFEIRMDHEIQNKILRQQMNSFEWIQSYQDYLLIKKTGDFTSSTYETKEMFSSEMMGEREKNTLLYLKGLKCKKCDTVYYLKSQKCKKCACPDFSEVQLSKSGTVYALTSEHYFPASFPPINMLVIDLDGGGRMTVQQTDTMYPENNKVKIGSRVELVFRKMIENDIRPNYFWKAKMKEHDEH